MTKTRQLFTRYRPGSPILAERLNEPLTAIETLTQSLRPPRDNISGSGLVGQQEQSPIAEALVDDDSPTTQQTVSFDAEQNVTTAETWRFVSKTTRTERVRDADNSDIYLDVIVTTSVTVKTPTGQNVTIELEN